MATATVSSSNNTAVGTPTSTTKTTQRHYERHTAESYESSFFSSPGAYIEFVCQRVKDRLGITPSSSPRTLLDIGGGTGNFTQMLIEDTPHIKAVVVDPFLELSSQHKQVQFIKAPAEAFREDRASLPWRQDYNQVLMKEMIHHLKESDRVGIFQSILGDLAENKGSAKTPGESTSILIVTRPKEDVDYPFWPEAKRVWERDQPSVEKLQGDLERAGFRRVTYTVEAYPCELPFSKWLNMIRNRFWSTFSHFSDEELEDACERLKRDETLRVDDKGNLHFEDRLLFLSAEA